MLTGSLETPYSNSHMSKTMTCPGGVGGAGDNTATHVDRKDKTEVTVEWRAPTNFQVKHNLSHQKGGIQLKVLLKNRASPPLWPLW